MKTESKLILADLAARIDKAISDDELYTILIELIQQFNRSYFNTLTNNVKFNKLKEYVVRNTAFLDSYFQNANIDLKLSTRCFYVLAKLTDILHCANPTCNKPIVRNCKPCTIDHQITAYCGDNLYCSQTDIRTIQKALASKLKRHGTYLNVELCKKTRIQRYGKYTTDEQIAKSKQTKLERHGNANYVNSEKANATKLRKYGSKNNIQKIRQTMLKRYGVEYSAQNHASYIKTKQKYMYNGIKFDSAWELAYYMHLKDNNIEFEYQPNRDVFMYFDKNGKQHRYFPDFYLVNAKQYIEIKGDNHFSSDGKPIINGKYDWSDRYKYIVDNNVQILVGKDILPIFKHYGGYKILNQYKCK